jgi:hypothetical protein
MMGDFGGYAAIFEISVLDGQYAYNYVECPFIWIKALNICIALFVVWVLSLVAFMLRIPFTKRKRKGE